MDKDRVVFITLGSLDIDASHLRTVQAALRFRHLVPLLIAPLRRMNLAKGLHRQEEYQLKVRDPAYQWPSLQSRDKPFSRACSH